MAVAPVSLALGQSVPKEGLIKAAFVFNFIKFVEWPETVFETQNSPIRLCIWGKNALGGALETLRNKTAKNRAIQVLYTERTKQAAGCHVLFVAENKRGSLKSIISRTKGKPVLTVGDSRGFAEDGGIIGLFRSDDKMRFAINVEAARQSGLRISSQLLRLGKIVSTDGER